MYCKLISPAQENRLITIAHILIETVRLETTFTDTMWIMLCCMWALEEAYGIYIVDMRILDILERNTSLKVLAASWRAAYIQFIEVGKTKKKSEGVLPFLWSWESSPQLERLFVSLTLMSKASTFLLRGTFSSRFRPLPRASITSTTMLLFLEIPITGSLRPFMKRFSFA